MTVPHTRTTSYTCRTHTYIHTLAHIWVFWANLKWHFVLQFEAVWRHLNATCRHSTLAQYTHIHAHTYESLTQTHLKTHIMICTPAKRWMGSIRGRECIIVTTAANICIWKQEIWISEWVCVCVCVYDKSNDPKLSSYNIWHTSKNEGKTIETGNQVNISTATAITTAIIAMTHTQTNTDQWRSQG